MTNLLNTFFFALVFSGSFADAAENREIDVLLSFVATSDCTFIRNGKKYQPLKAREHLMKKYNYEKSRIKTAEDFITKIASRSSMSKKPYYVLCEGKELLVEKWLTDALASHRNTEND